MPQPLSKQRPIRVLHVAETIKGGIASYLQTLDQVADEGYENHYLIPRQQADCLPVAPSRINTFEGANRLSRVYHLTLSLRRMLARQHFDLVHLHSSFAGYAYLLQRPLLRRPPKSIYCAHGWSFLRETSALETASCKAMDFSVGLAVDGIIHISHSESRAASFIRNGNQTVIHNPVEPLYLATTPRKQGGTEAGKRILFVGRLDRQKGFDLLYEAFGLAAMQQHKLIVAGAAVLGQQSYAATANVEFLGWQPREQLCRLYETCDLTVIPSRWEGFGLVAIESMARGTPVLANTAGSLPEVLGEAGTCMRLDSAQTIAEQILRSTSAESRLPALALQRYVGTRFSPERFSSQLGQFYTRILTSH